jgi:hypothetical protein
MDERNSRSNSVMEGGDMEVGDQGEGKRLEDIPMGKTDPDPVGLQKRLRAFVGNPFPGDVLDNVSGFRRHVNETADGLFDIFLSLVHEGTDHAEEKVAVLLEQLGQLCKREHSATEWELEDFLYLSGVSDRNRRMLKEQFNIGMHPSKMGDHMEKSIAKHWALLKDWLSDMTRVFMLVVDDFHVIWPSHTAKKNGRFSAAVHLANAILKNISRCGLDLSVTKYPDSLLPEAFSADAVESWITELWGASTSESYFSTRLKIFEKISSTLQPYACSEADETWENPISMKDVTLFRCFDNPFKKDEDMEKVFGECAREFAPYLEHQHMLATGDWHVFWNLLVLVRKNPALYGHLVPIPGPFHVALNAQEAIFFYYRGIISVIWDAVHPTKAFPIRPTPTERKYILDALCHAWKNCRTSLMRLFNTMDSVSSEAAILVQLFDEFIPLSLDLYAVFLSGDLVAYESLLVRSLRMFAQLGKNHYVLCISIFASEMAHWKKNFPAFYDQLVKNFQHLSEEEIEILHSTLRVHLHVQQNAKETARAVNFCGARAKMMRRWREEKAKKGHAKCSRSEPFPKGITRAIAALKRLFKSAIVCTTPCEPAEKHEWKSAVFSTFDDHLLPYAMQQANVRLRGCRGMSSNDRLEFTSFIDVKYRRLCGHERNGEDTCGECRNTILQIVREMMHVSQV